MTDKWVKTKQNKYFNCYRYRCPKCNHTFIMPKPWGVWKGCPLCWTKLKQPEGGEEE